MKNNTLTNVNEILFNIVVVWLDILDLPPRQCIYTLVVEGWTSLPAELLHIQSELIVISISLVPQLLFQFWKKE